MKVSGPTMDIASCVILTIDLKLYGIERFEYEEWYNCTETGNSHQ